ncbi:2-dehydro-3-deoxy-6-phosphogalactonate aldolase [Pseudoduganella sp. DS3]|uniref:2-dehydro-3-deoxy-6-phosphogalactonate aldolase n=1 Tax=Pseudoduganella guangdongensis TaxID=2692179 RepID=A0A6N9HMT6_9BURK|nr:2-dehydro-3-deoxy-6-phosphogalactonate aldolase [Pseudoduganella guangdongensis]MYN04978.1 2-dehydro-3-deoxy-6-phosphogalactonate aldolase [Pseudoduganella guangdongensis]
MNPHQFELPLVAILRGLSPSDAPAVGAALFEAGFRLLEVPLNRPGALESIRVLAGMAPDDAIVGGGTMLTVADVDAVAAAGGRLFVSPNCRPAVIAHAAARGMLCAPGVATPTEAFDALDAGAHALKLFPAESIGVAGVKALRTVLPAGTPLWPVGGVTPEQLPAWKDAGATGAGIGSQLYAPGVALDALAQRAAAYAAAWRA